MPRLTRARCGGHFLILLSGESSLGVVRFSLCPMNDSIER